MSPSLLKAVQSPSEIAMMPLIVVVVKCCAVVLVAGEHTTQTFLALLLDAALEVKVTCVKSVSVHY